MTDMALAVARLTAVSRLGAQGEIRRGSIRRIVRHVASFLASCIQGMAPDECRSSTPQVDWSFPMSFLRNNDVKKHLARAVPRSVAVATADPVADPDVETTFQPEDEVFTGPVTIEVPEKIRPM